MEDIHIFRGPRIASGCLFYVAHLILFQPGDKGPGIRGAVADDLAGAEREHKEIEAGIEVGRELAGMVREAVVVRELPFALSAKKELHNVGDGSPQYKKYLLKRRLFFSSSL